MPAFVDALPTTITVAQDNQLELTLYETPITDAGDLLQMSAQFANQTPTDRSYTAPRPAFATQLEWIAEAKLFDDTTDGQQHALAKTAAADAIALPFTDLSLRWVQTPSLLIDANHHPDLYWHASGSDTATIAFTDVNYTSTNGHGVRLDVWGPAPTSTGGAGALALPAFSDPDLQAGFAGNTSKFSVLVVQGKSYADVHATIASDLSDVQEAIAASFPVTATSLQTVSDRFPAATSVRLSTSP